MIVKYFGKIAEIVNSQSESWNESEMTIIDFKKKLIGKYPALESEIFQIAINLKIEDSNFIVPVDSEVAILPPFAGG